MPHEAQADKAGWWADGLTDMRTGGLVDRLTGVNLRGVREPGRGWTNGFGRAYRRYGCRTACPRRSEWAPPRRWSCPGACPDPGPPMPPGGAKDWLEVLFWNQQRSAWSRKWNFWWNQWNFWLDAWSHHRTNADQLMKGIRGMKGQGKRDREGKEGKCALTMTASMPWSSIS